MAPEQKNHYKKRGVSTPERTRKYLNTERERNEKNKEKTRNFNAHGGSGLYFIASNR